MGKLIIYREVACRATGALACHIKAVFIFVSRGGGSRPEGVGSCAASLQAVEYQAQAINRLSPQRFTCAYPSVAATVRQAIRLVGQEGMVCSEGKAQVLLDEANHPTSPDQIES